VAENPLPSDFKVVGHPLSSYFILIPSIDEFVVDGNTPSQHLE